MRSTHGAVACHRGEARSAGGTLLLSGSRQTVGSTKKIGKCTFVDERLRKRFRTLLEQLSDGTGDTGVDRKTIRRYEREAVVSSTSNSSGVAAGCDGRESGVESETPQESVD